MSGDSYYTDNPFALKRQRRAEALARRPTLYAGVTYRTSINLQRAYNHWIMTYVPPAVDVNNLLGRTARLMVFQQGHCYLCLKPFNDKRTPTDEHVIPRGKGGKNRKNILLACAPCNVRKSDRDPTPDELALCAAFYRIDATAKPGTIEGVYVYLETHDPPEPPPKPRKLKRKERDPYVMTQRELDLYKIRGVDKRGKP